MADNSTLTVAMVAQILHRDPQTVRYLVDNGLVSWGMSYKRKGSKRKSYLIFREKFQVETGIEIAESEVQNGGK